MSDVEGGSWELLDALRAIVREKHRDADDAITACVAIIAETLVMLDEDPQELRKHVETTKRVLDDAVSFKKHTGQGNG